MLSITFPDERKTSYQYNEKSLPQKITLASGITLSKEYDERDRVKTINIEGKKQTFQYDGRDRCTKMSSLGQETSFSYDECGNLISKIDSSNRKTSYDYDQYDRLIKAIDAVEGLTTYEYNLALLSKIHLPNGSIREIIYDEGFHPIGLR